jgi:hypothetical protein
MLPFSKGEFMKLKRALGFCVLVLLSVFSSACFTIEKEIFLNADGSGELILRVSIPDIPENLNAAPGVPQGNASQEIDKFKKDVMTRLPETVKLKEAKQVKQNGVMSFYALLEFKNLKDTEAIFAEFGKDNLNEVSTATTSEWTSQIEKKDGRTIFTERIAVDVGDSSKKALNPKTPPAKSRKAPGKRGTSTTKTQEPPSGFVGAKPPEVSDGAQSFEEQLAPLLLSLVSIRIVLHTPAPISESNADIVLNNNRIAVWNCSLIKFSKEKKPIEIKATF